MTTRRGEQLGWTLGWGGGFVWVLIVSIILLVDGLMREAVIGLVILATAVAAIRFFAPWRHPTATYRWLMIPIYLLFFVAVAWGVWALGDARKMGIGGWASALLLLPLFIPFWTVGERRWLDGEHSEGP